MITLEKAVITRITGQDGAYLAEFLSTVNYREAYNIFACNKTV